MLMKMAKHSKLFERLAKIFHDDNPNPGDLRLVIGKFTIDTDDDIVKLVEDSMRNRESIV